MLLDGARAEHAISWPQVLLAATLLTIGAPWLVGTLATGGGVEPVALLTTVIGAQRLAWVSDRPALLRARRMLTPMLLFGALGWGVFLGTTGGHWALILAVMAVNAMLCVGWLAGYRRQQNN